MSNAPESSRLWELTSPAASETSSLADAVCTDVTVIGGGYTGLSAALRLREQGISVVVLEADEIGSGGSGRNAGLVNAGLWLRPDAIVAAFGNDRGERLIQLLSDGPAQVFGLVERYRIECEAKRSGTLHCAVGRSGLDDLKCRELQWKRRGAPVELLAAGEAAKRIGSKAFAGALFDARAGTIQPLAYARGLASAAIARGARIFTKSPALAAGRFGREWEVRTPTGSVRSSWIIVATDAYARGPWEIARTEQIRLPYFQVATAPLDEATRATILLRGEGAWDTAKVLSSFRLDAAGRLVFGSVGALSGFGRRVHQDWARRAAFRIFPQLREFRIEAAWHGSIGMTSDSLPRFHRYADQVIGLSGYNGRGIAPGTVFGKLLADLAGSQASPEEIPVPLTTPDIPFLPALRELTYELGAQAWHFVGARL